jgi:hypothetical protein
MGDSAHTTHHTKAGENQHPPLFLEDENIFQKSARLVVSGIEFRLYNHASRFLKKVLIFEKKGGC